MADIRIQWSNDEMVYAAVFLRKPSAEGSNLAPQEWYLNGALVGMDSTRGDALDDLLGIAENLVLEGENFLTNGQIPLDDRVWLFQQLDDAGCDPALNQRMYEALRAAGMPGLGERYRDIQQKPIEPTPGDEELLQELLGRSQRRLGINPEPLAVIPVQRCRKCRVKAPWCRCIDGPEYE